MTNSETEMKTNPKMVLRRRLIRALLLVSVLAGAAWWGWHEYIAPPTESTDNAYTEAEIADVTALVSGPIEKVLVHDTDAVKAGDVLVLLDKKDAQIRLARTSAALDEAERRVRQLYINASLIGEKAESRRAAVAANESSLLRLRTNLEKANRDLKRQKALARAEATSDEKLTNAQTAAAAALASVKEAESRLESAKADLRTVLEEQRANDALIAGVSVETHPLVLAAKAERDQAALDLERTTVRAPIDGVVGQRTAEVGRRIQAGVRLMTVTPVEKIYVNANFKEPQLEGIRVGQKVDLRADIYGKSVLYSGRVVGLSAASGSALAPIPAQNATGNWIKVVQRLPVRIEIDPEDLKRAPLRVGLSMHATVYLGTEGTK